MKNNTILKFADNGIIVHYEDDGSMEIMEHNTNLENTFLKQIDLKEKQKTIGLMYGGIVANSLQCFNEDVLREAVGFKINIELTPIYNKKNLIL